eukprot:scaffold695631_cov63-Attheya_sp.AAC.2
MCALNCLTWHLQDSLVVPVVAADDKYTEMICMFVYLSWCFHKEIHDFQDVPDLRKLVNKKVSSGWMLLNKADSPELEEQTLASIIAYVHHFDGSLVHPLVIQMVPLERRFVCVVCHHGFAVWSEHDEVAAGCCDCSFEDNGENKG